MASRPTVAWALLQTFYSGLFGARWENLMFYKPDGAIPGGFNVQTAAATMAGAWATNIGSLMATDNVILGARFYVNNGVYTTSADVDQNLAGSASGGALPPDDFVVVRSQSNAAGRSAKGRLLLGGLSTSIGGNGRVDSSGASALATIITFLTTAVSASSVSFTAAHFDRKNNSFTIPDFWSYNPVLGNRKKRSPVF